MKKTIIIQHTISGLYQDTLLLSTVKVGNIYETALLDSDMEEIEMYRTGSQDEALAAHWRIADECFEKAQAAYPGISTFWKRSQVIKNYNDNSWNLWA